MIIFIQINGNKSSWITIKFKDFFGQSRCFCSVQQVPLVETRARSQHFQTNTRPPLLSAWGPEGSRKRPNALLNSTVKHCNVATTTANGFHLGLLEILKTQPLFSSLSPILLHSHSNSSGPWRALELFGSGTKLRKKRHFNSIFKLLNWCNDGWKMFLNLMVFCVCFTIYKKSLNKNTRKCCITEGRGPRRVTAFLGLDLVLSIRLWKTSKSVSSRTRRWMRPVYRGLTIVPQLWQNRSCDIQSLGRGQSLLCASPVLSSVKL